MATLRAPYRGDEPYVFVCYSHEDEAMVIPEIAWLQTEGVNVWYDAGISAGKIWREEIAQVLGSASMLVYYVSPRSIASEQCSRELHFALDRNRPVLPIYLEEVELSGELELSLSRVQALKVSDPSWRDKALAALHEATGRPLKSPSTPTPRTGESFLSARLWISLAAAALFLSTAVWYVGRDSKDAEGGSSLDTLAVLPVEILTERPALIAFGRIVEQDLVTEFSDTGLLSLVDLDAQPGLTLRSSLRSVNGGVRVVFRLVREANGGVLWSDDIDQVFPQDSEALGFDRAAFVARMTEATAASYEESRAGGGPESARDAEFRGLVEWNKTVLGGGGDFRVMVEYFEEALRIDPGSSLAAAMLTTAYANRLGGRITAAEAGPKAHAAAARLLRMSPTWTFFLGKLNMDIDLDYQAALENFQYAVGSMDPPTLENNLGILRLLQGDPLDAMDHFDRALAMGAHSDSVWSLYHLALVHLMAGRYRRAQERLEQARSNSMYEPVHVWTLRCLATYLAGDHQLARQCVDAAWESHGARFPHRFPNVLYLAGRVDAAGAVLEQMERQAQSEELSVNVEAFLAYVSMGDYDRAFEWLMRSISNREHLAIILIRNDVRLDAMRRDSRFTEALALLASIEAEGSPTTSDAMQ